MSKSVTEAQSKKAITLVNKVIEPKFHSIIAEANKILNKHGIQIGASVDWFIDKYEEKNEE